MNRLNENEMKMIKNQIFDNLIYLDRNNEYQIFNSIILYDFNKIKIRFYELLDIENRENLFDEYFIIRISENNYIKIFKIDNKKEIFSIDLDLLDIKNISLIIYELFEKYFNEKLNIL